MLVNYTQSYPTIASAHRPQFLKVERMAVVADDSWDEWMTWMVRITGIFTGLLVRFFKAGKIEEAWDWLEAA